MQNACNAAQQVPMPLRSCDTRSAHLCSQRHGSKGLTQRLQGREQGAGKRVRKGANSNRTHGR